jgi:hypothetical protein
MTVSTLSSHLHPCSGEHSGSVTAYDDFYPYGQTMDGRSSNAGMPETRFKYTGKERDVESQYLSRNHPSWLTSLACSVSLGN